MFEYLFALEWEIAKDRLMALKASTNCTGFLESDIFAVNNASGINYSLAIHPNGPSEKHPGKTWLFLKLNVGNQKKIKAEFTLSILSAKWSHKFNYMFEKSEGLGRSCCTIDQLFDPEKNFFVDEKLIVKVEGIFKFECVELKTLRKLLKPKRKLTTTSRSLWDSDFKDFTFVVDGKNIEVHKCVLSTHSPVFQAMFKSSMKEAIENKVEITDFSYDIVEKALKLCYDCNFDIDILINESFLLLKFADKYDIMVLKESLEELLSDKIKVTNVCEIASHSFTANALKLQSRCQEFFTECLSRKAVVPNLELLEKTFLINAITSLSCRKSQTL